MTHAERMAALVAAVNHHAECMGAVEDGKPHWEQPTNDFNLRMAFTKVAHAGCDSGPTIALAAEGMRLLTLYRAATKQRAEDEREHCAAGLTCSIEDLVAIEERLDKLLAQWEEMA